MSNIEKLINILKNCNVPFVESRLHSTYAIDYAGGFMLELKSRAAVSQAISMAVDSSDAHNLEDTLLLLTICRFFSYMMDKSEVSDIGKFMELCRDEFDLKSLNGGQEFNFELPVANVILLNI